jgi:hypothetical protein
MRFSGKHHDSDVPFPLRNPERVTLPVNHQDRHPRPRQLIRPGPLRAPRRVQRECQGNHPRCSRPDSRPAGDPGAVAPPTLDQRYRRTSALRLGNDLEPGGVLLVGRARRSGPPNPVGLENAGHCGTMIESRLPGGEQVGAVHPAACPVRQHQQESWSPDIIELDVGWARSCHDLHSAQRNPLRPECPAPAIHRLRPAARRPDSSSECPPLLNAARLIAPRDSRRARR